MTWHWWRYQQPIASRLSGFFQRCDHQKLLWCHRQLHSAKKDSVRVQYSKALVENCQICPLLKIPPFFGSWDFFAFVVTLPVKKKGQSERILAKIPQQNSLKMWSSLPPWWVIESFLAKIWPSVFSPINSAVDGGDWENGTRYLPYSLLFFLFHNTVIFLNTVD